MLFTMTDGHSLMESCVATMMDSISFADHLSADDGRSMRRSMHRMDPPAAERFCCRTEFCRVAGGVVPKCVHISLAALAQELFAERRSTHVREPQAKGNPVRCGDHPN